MTTQQLFLLMACFAFSTLNAQTCEPGLEQIPPMSDSDYNPSGAPNWFTFGNQLAANQITLSESGNMTQVNYVKGSIVTGGVRAAVYNSDMQLVAESNIVNPAFTGTGAIDTVTVPLQVPIFVNVGEIYYVGVKFAGNDSRVLRKFDDAEGVRFQFGNPWSFPFPSSLPSNLITQPGLYAIWGIVEQCEPSVQGCTDAAACNYNINATLDDGTCAYACNPTVCALGLNELGEFADDDVFTGGQPVWENSGSTLHANFFTSPESGTLSSLRFVTGRSFPFTVTAAVYNVDVITGFTKVSESDPVLFSPNNDGGVDTVSIPLLSPVEIIQGNNYVLGIRFSPTFANDKLLRRVDGAPGFRIELETSGANPFPATLVTTELTITSGKYAIWGVVDGCIDVITGCTDSTACNFNPAAIADDGSCEFTSCLCTADLNNDNSRNVADVLLMLADFGCSAGCIGDLDNDGATTASDFLVLLGLFGTSCN